MKFHPTSIKFLSLFGGLLIALSLLISSCTTKQQSQVFDQGTIVYDVSFPFDSDNPYINIYPKEMVLTFKEDKVRAKLASFAEVVCSEFIIDNESKTFSQFFKVFDEKYQMDLDQAGVEQMLNTFPSMELRTTAELDSLAGMLCAKSVAHFMDHSAHPIDLYHTPYIQMASPNWYNQFKDLHEVLLSYEIEQFGKRMRLEAREVRFETISDEQFQAPAGYDSVDLLQMHEQIESLVAQFDQ